MDIKPRQLEIIEAAGQLVTEDGFAALTTKRLAERMHFTEAALYRHFNSKEEILVTMLHHLAANIDERLTAVAETHPDPLERVRAMFDSQFTYFQKNPQYLMAIFATGVLEASHGIDAGIEPRKAKRGEYRIDERDRPAPARHGDQRPEIDDQRRCHAERETVR